MDIRSNGLWKEECEGSKVCEENIIVKAECIFKLCSPVWQAIHWLSTALSSSKVRGLYLI